MKYITVMSGKGGVGKSTIAANLAIALSKEHKTGLNDIDLSCPSIPQIMRITQKLTAKEKIIPIDYNGLKVVSIDLIPILDEGQFHAWRGNTVTEMIRECLNGTDWGELEYMVLDLPPSTRDETLTILDELREKELGAVVVAQPNKVAMRDVVKAVNLLKHLKIPIIGVVYNFVGGVFGNSIENFTSMLEIPNIGEIQLSPKIRIDGDSGTPHLWEEDSFRGVVDSVKKFWEARHVEG